MSHVRTLKGSCLCGAVSLQLETDKHDIGACHCNMCRTWGGGPLLALESVSQIQIQGEEHISRYSSSDWAERAFCRHCGTHLYYRLKDQPHYAIPAGLVDQGEDWVFDSQIFIDEKPAWYHFANDTRNMTGKEVFEAFTKEQDHS